MILVIRNGARGISLRAERRRTGAARTSGGVPCPRKGSMNGAVRQRVGRSDRCHAGSSAAARRRAAGVIAALLLAVLSGLLFGQTISFDIRRPALAQLRSNDLWDITLRNPTLDTWPVYLHVEAYAVEAGPVFAANSQEISLAPGKMSLTAESLQLSDVWCEKGYEAFAVPDSHLPEGDYTYVITLVPEMTPVSFVLQVRQPRPMDLVWPKNGAALRDSLPLFVWSYPVVPWYAGEYLYSVRVAEMHRGQSCASATSSETTIVEYCRSSQTVWRYPDWARKLIPGRTYGWRVDA
jgi:hypothetical protein